MKIDEVDMRILHELQTDSRLSIRELSKRVNLSPPSVTERVRRLEEHNIIEGYTIRLNKKKLGCAIDCIVEVTMKDGQYETFKEFMKDYEYSEWCYRIAGAACFIVKLSVPSLADIEHFINAISSYALTETSIVFSQVDVNDRIINLL
ncbi:transcriptional regulator, AsnC family [Desulfitobacterium hafniense DCB-2]|uniref:Transcriptional regulator, AsnC family n=1 Tax=Desulfitobacterium hafniense (strain DSM 10664 / DCB-2) TaxID=272564 RepID=B8FSM9_DESHD|nr:Lrp/AsnC family transcriptional regulator [Desulfitobacterium hafniense]ACL20240.1 transcriptional regulator, AsnC family [Desulfitobacterium hafniense DCB-2]